MENHLASENTTSSKLNDNFTQVINNTVTNIKTSEKMPKKDLTDIYNEGLYKDIKWLTGC